MKAVRDPLISVVMSVYNGGSQLPAAMESILRQTVQDLEFIVINDGSRDDTLECLRHYARTDPRLRVISRNNCGLTASLNEGLRLARGEFVARMDADDRASPERLARQTEAMQQDPELVAIGSWARCIEESGHPVFTWRTPERHEEIDARHVSGEPGALIHPTAVIRRTALIRAQGYDESFETAQDLDLWLRLAESGRLANLPEPLLDYRLGLHAITQRRRVRQETDVTEAIRRARLRRGLPPIDRRVDPVYLETSPESVLHRWITMALRERQFRTARILGLRLIRAKPGSLASWRRMAGVLWRGLRRE
jgi:glycosyltransferase involved in cell wall biosynthesis